MKRFFYVPSVLAVAVLMSGAAALAQDVAQAQKERSQIMKNLSSTMKEFKKVAAGGKPGSAEAQKAAQLQANIKKFLTLFPKGSDSSMIKTRAKPDIWAQWPKFEATGEKLIAALGTVEAAANGGDPSAFGAAFKQTGSVCGTCHKPFRGPKP